MDNLNMPRIDATTVEGKIAQIVNFMFILVRDHNLQIQELERQIHELKGEINNGNIHRT